MNPSQPDDDEDREYVIGSDGVVERTDVARDALLLMGQLVEYRDDRTATAHLFTNVQDKYGSIAALVYKDALILNKHCVVAPLIDKLIGCGVSYDEITSLIIAATRQLEEP